MGVQWRPRVVEPTSTKEPDLALRPQLASHFALLSLMGGGTPCTRRPPSSRRVTRPTTMLGAGSARYFR